MKRVDDTIYRYKTSNVGDDSWLNLRRNFGRGKQYSREIKENDGKQYTKFQR